MPGLVPGVHDLHSIKKEDADGQVKPGHDEKNDGRPAMPAVAPQEKPQSDHATLAALNTDYINAVQNSDVKRFDEILSDEFHCSNPDGSLIDRAAFLKQTAQPVAIKN